LVFLYLPPPLIPSSPCISTLHLYQCPLPYLCPQLPYLIQLLLPYLCIKLPYLGPRLPYLDSYSYPIIPHFSPKIIRCYGDHANDLDFALIEQLCSWRLETCRPNTGAACRCLVLYPVSPTSIILSPGILLPCPLRSLLPYLDSFSYPIFPHSSPKNHMVLR
jgi:hypothetical protein